MTYNVFGGTLNPAQSNLWTNRAVLWGGNGLGICVLDVSPGAPRGRGVFGRFLPLSVSVTYFSHRNIFDSCVKSWRYLRMHSISLESTFHWLLKIQSSLRSCWGLREICKKSTARSMFWLGKQQIVAAHFHARWGYNIITTITTHARLDVGRITGNFHFSFVPVGTLVIYISSWARANFFSFMEGGQRDVSNVTYRTHVALRCGCSVPAAEWLDSSAVGIA